MPEERRSRPRWKEVAGLASEQKGLVARWQLLACGWSEGAIDGWVRSGLLHRVHPGVYLVGHMVMPDGARELAGVLAGGKDAVLSHRSAAEVWGLVDPQAWRTPQVTVPGHRRSGPAGVRFHRTRKLYDDEVDRRNGIPVTSAARTIFDFASQAARAEIERAYEEGLVERYFTRDDMIRMAMRHRGRRGIRAIRRLIDRDAPPSKTIREAHRMLLELIRSSSLPHPKTEVPVGRYRVDILWPDARLIVEMDGAKWHNTPRRIEFDKRRDAELAALGYLTIRVTWSELTAHPAAVLTRIAQAYATRATHRAPREVAIAAE
jgi:very-short-patch-repair endonuclease